MMKEKTGPSDGSYNDMYDDENEEDERAKEKNELYKKEMVALEKEGEEMRTKEKEKLERIKKNQKEREESKKKSKEKKVVELDGQIIEKRVYSHTKKEGIFIRGKATNYSQKIDKALRKVHGVSLKKKKEIAEIIRDCASKKTTITAKEVDDILSKLKYKSYTGSGSGGINRMLKNKKKEGVDLKSYKNELKRKFSRRDIDKFKIALKGGKDPYKHEMKSNPNRISGGASGTGPSSSASRTSKKI